VRRYLRFGLHGGGEDIACRGHDLVTVAPDRIDLVCGSSLILQLLLKSDAFTGQRQ
jgi:hypothetical protein